MSKQGVWYAWDSRGGERSHPRSIQLVNFDLEKNRAAWSALDGVTITGSIESGRMTYKTGGVRVEFWREDKPNPTHFTEVDNPDPIRDEDGDMRTWAS